MQLFLASPPSSLACYLFGTDLQSVGSPLGETVEKASFLGLTLSQLLARDYHLTIQGTSLEVCWSLAVAQIHSEPLVPGVMG